MRTFFGLICLLAGSAAFAQQTVFNVPSVDVLDRGKAYAEFDITYQHSSDAASFTPRFVVGVGHNMEAGLNLNGFGVPGEQFFTPTPTVKWKLYEGKQNGWAWLVGDDLFVPVQNRKYDAGNYVWTELAHSWNSGTRATFGVFHFTSGVVSSKAEVGAQFAFEQPISKRVAFATDCFTGSSAVGYLTPGLVVKVTPHLTWYGTYQFGNHGLTHGNHQALFEVGWNF